jgi:hypothetical protein
MSMIDFQHGQLPERQGKERSKGRKEDLPKIRKQSLRQDWPKRSEEKMEQRDPIECTCSYVRRAAGAFCPRCFEALEAEWIPSIEKLMEEFETIQMQIIHSHEMEGVDTYLLAL